MKKKKTDIFDNFNYYKKQNSHEGKTRQTDAQERGNVARSELDIANDAEFPLLSTFTDTQTSHRKKAKGQHAKEKKSEDSTVCMNTAGQRESEVKTVQIEGHGKMIRGHTQDEAHQQQVDPHPTKTASQPTNFPKQLKHLMSQTSQKKFG